MKIITAVLVMAAGALSAQERVREFEPFNRFMERTRFASSMDLRSPRSKVRGAAAFNEMHRHLLKTYGVVEVKHSFVREGSHFDCVPVNQQPAVRELALESIAEAPPQALLANAAAAEMSARAAEELRLTAEDLHHEGIVDQVIDEPEGGAQTSHDETARLLDSVLCARLAESATSKVEERLTRRYEKLRQLGKWGTSDASGSS